jgi:type IX secretion system PorP/SprF family membrane protein
MITRIIILVVGCLLFQTAISQDFHFSQYNENPQLVNPALAGSNQVMRASIVYRTQWSAVATPYTTYGLSFESRFKASNWEKADPKRSMIFKKAKNRMAGGISIYNDKAGDAKVGTFVTNLTYAMFFPLNKHSSISLGLQGGFAQRKMDDSKLIYGAQYNGYTYDANLPSGELYSRQSFMYGDMGGGIAYTFNRGERSIAANDQISAQVGLQMAKAIECIENMCFMVICYLEFLIHYWE